jgi:hypothetical protein
VAENVEFWFSSCGEKRKGMTTITLAGDGYNDGSITFVPFLFRHLPTGDETAAELWSVWTQSNPVGAFYFERMTTSNTGLQTWTTVAPPDTFDLTGPNVFRMRAASLHGKMFLAYNSVAVIGTNADRLHVWDGTTLRRTGIAPPLNAPTAVDNGVGTFSGVRYYRFRYVFISGGVVIRRSEPSPVLTFTPSGSGSGAKITEIALLIGHDPITHWEVEASLDNANFYRIATVASTGFATYIDTVPYATGYAAAGTLSEVSGNYTNIWSARYLTVDQDRLIVAGSFVSATDGLGSTVGWTPVTNDPGVGNDERIPIATNNTLTLDNLSGGDITGMSSPTNGFIFVFKQSRIYKLVRTNQLLNAYNSFLLSTARGAIIGSVVDGIDENGFPCVYFLDPRVGPCRLGAEGLQAIGYDVMSTWNTFNANAILPCVGLFYPDKWQLHYWIATGSSTFPNKKIICQINNMETITSSGVNTPASYGGLARRGWSTASTGASVFAFSACMFSNNLGTMAPLSLKLIPLLGLPVSTIGTHQLIQQADTGSLDNGLAYSALVTTRPQIIENLTMKGGIRAGSVLAAPATGVTISVQAITDFGLDSTQIDGIDLTPLSTETQVIRPLDNLCQSEARVIQLSFGDLASPSGLWQVNGIVSVVRDEETL